MRTLHIYISLSLSYMLQLYFYIGDLRLAYKCHVRPDNLLYALLTTTVVALIIKGLHLFQSHKDNTSWNSKRKLN